MISFGIQVQCRIKQSDRPADAEITVFRSYTIHNPINICPALSFPLFREQRELRHLIRWRETGDFYGEASDRFAAGMAAPENGHGSFPDHQSVVGWACQLELTVKGSQVIGADPHSYC